MALIVCQQVETTIPIEVAGITPDALSGKSNKQIAKLPIRHGRHELELGELFKVSGSLSDSPVESSNDSAKASPTIVFDGILEPVHWIGSGLKSGTIQIETPAGRHIGSQMSGGRIMCKSNVSDYLGVEMTGGSITVAGDAGDCVGGHYQGSKFGMNRGSILISGNVGKGLGQAMRRGTIAVGGHAGELVGWNMLAGTIIILGTVGEHVGASMKRGTIVIAGSTAPQLLPTFSSGGSYPVPVLAMLANWLEQQEFPHDVSCLRSKYHEFNGDHLNGGRGELMVRAETISK